MAIEITHLGGNAYHASVSPPDAHYRWDSTQWMTGLELDRKLGDLGCHPVDVDDAFRAADGDWGSRAARERRDA